MRSKQVSVQNAQLTDQVKKRNQLPFAVGHSLRSPSLAEILRRCRITHHPIRCLTPGYSATPIIRGAFRLGCGLAVAPNTACCTDNDGARCRRSRTSVP